MTTTYLPGVRGASAMISPSGSYRYGLQRRWQHGDPAWFTFVMLNPSTADSTEDDPTIRRCVGFAKREGYTSLVVANLYAWRATDPRELLTAVDPVGPDNDTYLRKLLEAARDDVPTRPVVAAWGANAQPARVVAFRELADRIGVPLWCLGTTKRGAPRHPLYVAGDAPLVRWPVVDTLLKSE